MVHGARFELPHEIYFVSLQVFNHLAKEERAGCHVIAIWLLYSIVFFRWYCGLVQCVIVAFGSHTHYRIKQKKITNKHYFLGSVMTHNL